MRSKMAKKSRARPRPRARSFPGRRIIIATEGRKTEPIYFHELKELLRLLNVDVVRRDRDSSTPADVVKSLIQYQSNKINDVRTDDELWAVIDHDKHDLQAAVALVEKSRVPIRFVDSNPCFEMWLILHHRSIAEYDQETLQELKANRRNGKRSRLEKELVAVCGSYNKSRLKTSDYLPHVETAIANAKSADTEPDSRWLSNVGSRVYKLAESIIESAPNRRLN